MVQIASRLRDNENFIAGLERLLRKAKAGEVYGVIGAIDLGGGVYEYHGEGSFVVNPMIGYAAATKLKKQFV